MPEAISLIVAITTMPFLATSAVESHHQLGKANLDESWANFKRMFNKSYADEENEYR
jgi:hypothetical protein